MGKGKRSKTRTAKQRQTLEPPRQQTQDRWARRNFIVTLVTGIAGALGNWWPSWRPTASTPTPTRRNHTLVADSGAYALTGSDALLMHEKLDVKVIKGKPGA